ncbi:DUF4058 family protein [Tautonia plasticadhaerens]|uniref:DUF4058 domain-containing protein n=1 Tax=Tautonia plasticadhaerens TaxID=2527974 RepID=A0A518HDS0_9BACT|nr:DUF4058 family protein [Tautonia plasticadhaerens]QDV39002.1 hypothetical protein ElP_69630 [Tautonia plasticadhaerens]
MPTIFPGMDPYLEHPSLWPGFHNWFIISMAEAMQQRLRPRYLAAVEARVYIEGGDRDVIPDVLIRRPGPRPDGPGPGGRQAVAVAEEDGPVIVRAAPGVEVNESYLTILDRSSGLRVVTVIELLSPSNKCRGPGRSLYRQKQRDVLGSDAHLVELDLLRTGRHTVAVPGGLAESRGPYHYLICVTRARRPRDEFELYPRSLRRPLPTLSIPLADPDPDLRLDLNPVLSRTYDAGSYRDRIDYARPCRPALSDEDQAWADGLIRRPEPPADV